MRGVITTREVILHGLTIVRLWGARCYMRCLRAALGRSPSTFLGVVSHCRECDPGSDPSHREESAGALIPLLASHERRG